MRLRYDGSCRPCEQGLAAGTVAVYERASKTVRCEHRAATATAPSPLAPQEAHTPTPAPGHPGTSEETSPEPNLDPGDVVLKTVSVRRLDVDKHELDPAVVVDRPHTVDRPTRSHAVVMGCRHSDRTGNVATSAEARQPPSPTHNPTLACAVLPLREIYKRHRTMLQYRKLGQLWAPDSSTSAGRHPRSQNSKWSRLDQDSQRYHATRPPREIMTSHISWRAAMRALRTALSIASLLVASACGSPSTESCAAPHPILSPSHASPGSKVTVKVDLSVACVDTNHPDSPVPPRKWQGIPINLVQGDRQVRLATVDSDTSGHLSAEVKIPNDAEAGQAAIRVKFAEDAPLTID